MICLKRIVILCWLIPTSLFAQQHAKDSLKNLLAYVAGPSEKVHLYGLLSKEYKKINIDSSILYGKQAVKICAQANLKNLADAYLILADAYRYANQFDSSKHFYQSAVAKCMVVKDSVCLYKTYNNLGILFKDFNFLEDAAFMYEKSLTIKLALREYQAAGNTYENLAVLAIRKGELQRAKTILIKSIALRDHYHLTKGLDKVLQNLANTYAQLNQYDSALYFYKQVQNIYVHQRDQSLQAALFNNIANVYTRQGWHRKALSYYIQSSKFYEQTNMPEPLGTLYQNIGSLLVKQKDLSRSLQYYHKSLSIYVRIHDQVGRCEIYHCLSDVQRLRKQYKAALKLEKKSLVIADSIQYEKGRANALSTLGDIHVKLGRYKQALYYFSKSMPLLIKLNYKHELAIVYNRIGACYFFMNEYEKANSNYEAALALGNTIHARDIQSEALFNLAESFGVTHQFKKAYELFLQYKFMKDTLFDEKQNASIQEMIAKYETEKKETEIKQLELRRSVQQSRLEQKQVENHAFLIITMLLVLVSILIFVAYRQNRKINKNLKTKNTLIEGQVQKKELLHRELHHRVKNNLQLISSIMNLQSHSSDEREISDAIQESKFRVDAMTSIHQNLYQRDQIASVNIKSYLENLTRNLNATLGKHVVTTTMEIEDVEIFTDHVIPIGLITNELLFNSFKHAIPTNGVLTIHVSFTVYDDSCILTVSDNGCNVMEMDLSSSKTKDSFGLELIRSLTEQIDGTIDVVHNSTGTTASLILNRNIVASPVCLEEVELTH